MRARCLALALCGLLALACHSDPRAPSQFPISRAELEGAPSANTAEAEDDPAELTYRRYCIGCHGADGHGNGGTTGADLAGPNSPLHTRSEAELIASVRDGKVGKVASMPAHGPVLSAVQIAAVVGYVQKQFGEADAN